MKQQYEEKAEAFEPMKSNKPYWAALSISMLWVIVLLIAVAMHSSCSTSRRIAKACKTLDAHPKEGAKYCGTKWPPIEKKTTTIKYKPGRPYPVPGETQYVTVDCDSVMKATKSNPSKNSSSSKVRVPIPTYLQVDTAAITTDIERENVAKLAYKDAVIDSFKGACMKLSEDRKSALESVIKSTKSAIYGWLAFTLLALIDIVILWLMKKGVIR